MALIGLTEPSMKQRLTKEQLWVHLKAFIKANFAFRSIPKELFLIVNRVEDVLSSFENLNDLNPFEASDRIFAKFTINDDETRHTVHFKGLSALTNGKLSEISSIAGLKMPSLEGVDGKNQEYWEKNLKELWVNVPEAYECLANRDAEIQYRAYTKIREFSIHKYGTDILHFNTLPRLAEYVFRKDYLKEPLVPTKLNPKLKFQKKGSNTYKFVQNDTIYSGSLDVRLLALLSYHGGRIECFYIGRIEEENLSYYDVVSLYPSSALIQPLPCKTTRWMDITQANRYLLSQLLREGHGFTEVEFEFKESVNYPCLPVYGVRDKLLYFPLSGTSYCTLEELRLATKLGLKHSKILSGFAFLPTIKEHNNPLKHYMRDVLSGKKESSKGSLEYEMYKLLMNSLVGKLIERKGDTRSSDEGRKNSGREFAGNLWMPEASSLIIGKARAIISEFVNKGAYFVSTDSVLLPKSVSIECPTLDELRDVGSDLKKEFDVSHGILIKSMLYVLNPLEEDKSRRHIARHSVLASEDDFLKIVREGFISKAIPNLEFTRVRRIKLKDSLTSGRPLNSPHKSNGAIELKYDGKRKPIHSVQNPFAMGTWTKPLTSEESYNNPQRKKPRKPYRLSKTRKIRNPRKQKPPSDRILEIFNLFQSGKSQTEIAQEFKCSRQYIHKVITQYYSETGSPTLEDTGS